jgi:hypothetical protein
MRIPNFKDPEVTKFLTEWDREIKRVQRDAMSNVTANRAVLLHSPDLAVWEISITNAGAIIATKIQG